MALAVAAPANADQAAAGTVSAPIVEGLIGPLGLDVTSAGTILVAEGFAGQITRVTSGGQRSVIVSSNGDSITGVVGSVLGRAVFTRAVSAGGPEQPATATSLERVQPNGTVTVLADLLTFEEDNNPDAGNTYGFENLPAGCESKLTGFGLPYQGIIESNPYKVEALSPVSFAVADAAGNSILRVTGVGQEPDLVAVLPGAPQRITPGTAREFDLPACTIGRVYTSEPVATDIEVGPDGYWYVSSLAGAPEQVNAGSVFRVNPDTGAVSVVARGFNGAVDLAVADDGTIYVAELFGNRISAISNGVVSTVADLFSPGAVELSDDGTIYATTGVFGPSGSVVTVTP